VTASSELHQTYLEKVEKRTSLKIDLHDHFMVGASEEDGSWRPDLVVSNTDKKTWPHRINTDGDCRHCEKKRSNKLRYVR